MLDADSVLRGRIEAALGELEQAKEMLAEMPAGLIELYVQERVQKDLRRRIVGLTESLERDRQEAASWASVKNHTAECPAVLRECQDLLEGALARARNLDRGLCRLADALLDELGGKAGVNWGSLTVLGDAERIVSFTRTIRLRFPLGNIWSLPIAAHEFGHFMAGQLKGKDLDGAPALVFQGYLRQKNAGIGTKEWYYLNEYFADVFGAYALGPAFACTCFLLRFEPARAHEEVDGLHPPEASRAYVIQQTLKRMNKRTAGQYGGLLNNLGKAWSDSLQATQQQELTDEQRKPLDEMVRILSEMIEEGAPEAQYQSWSRAQTLQANRLTPSPGGGKQSIADVLNAAWGLRLGTKSEEERVDLDAKARKLCDQVVGTPAAQG